MIIKEKSFELDLIVLNKLTTNPIKLSGINNNNKRRPLPGLHGPPGSTLHKIKIVPQIIV
jgi:hypothetical protein